MNLDELQSARSTERQRDSLQTLADTFYADVGEFVRELRTERDRAAEATDDPFDAPEVRRLTDDIKTAENTAEAIYERRVGKLVKLASLEAAGMATDDEGLTTEERDLFETLVARIEDSRTRVLDDVLAGADADSTPDADPGTASERTGAAESAAPSADRSPREADRSGTDAADAMGAGPEASPGPGTASGTETADGTRADAADGVVGNAARTDGSGADAANGAGTGNDATRAPSTPEVDGMTPEDTDPTTPSEGADEAGSAGEARPGNDARDAPPETREGATPDADDVAAPGDDRGSADADDPDAAATDRTTVRVTRDVGEILGVDERVYDLSAEDVVTLPVVNAGPLVERDAAEPLDRA